VDSIEYLAMAWLSTAGKAPGIGERLSTVLDVEQIGSVYEAIMGLRWK